MRPSVATPGVERAERAEPSRTAAVTKVRNTKVSTRPLASTRSNTCNMYRGDARTNRLMPQLNRTSAAKPGLSARDARSSGLACPCLARDMIPTRC